MPVATKTPSSTVHVKLSRFETRIVTSIVCTYTSMNRQRDALIFSISRLIALLRATLAGILTAVVAFFSVFGKRSTQVA